MVCAPGGMSSEAKAIGTNHAKVAKVQASVASAEKRMRPPAMATG